MYTHPLNPDRLMTDQSMDTTKVQLRETMSFMGVTYRNMRGLSYWSRNDSKTSASQRSISAWVTVHIAGNLVYPTEPAGSSGGCKVSFPDGSVGLNLFGQLSRFLLLPGSWSGPRVFVAQLLSFWGGSPLSLPTLAGRSLVDLVGFRDFLMLLSTFLFKELPCRMECFQGNYYPVPRLT